MRDHHLEQAGEGFSTDKGRSILGPELRPAKGNKEKTLASHLCLLVSDLIELRGPLEDSAVIRTRSRCRKIHGRTQPRARNAG